MIKLTQFKKRASNNLNTRNQHLLEETNQKKLSDKFSAFHDYSQMPNKRVGGKSVSRVVKNIHSHTWLALATLLNTFSTLLD